MVFPSKKSSFIIQSIESCILRIRIKEKGGGEIWIFRIFISSDLKNPKQSLCLTPYARCCIRVTDSSSCSFITSTGKCNYYYSNKLEWQSTSHRAHYHLQSLHLSPFYSFFFFWVIYPPYCSAISIICIQRGPLPNGQYLYLVGLLGRSYFWPLPWRKRSFEYYRGNKSASQLWFLWVIDQLYSEGSDLDSELFIKNSEEVVNMILAGLLSCLLYMQFSLPDFALCQYPTFKPLRL